jgi:hypothetical protein
MVVGYVGGLSSMRGGADNDFLPPWEDYHHALTEAQAARAQFLQVGFLATAKSLRDRICRRARKRHIRLCPLCC